MSSTDDPRRVAGPSAATVKYFTLPHEKLAPVYEDGADLARFSSRASLTTARISGISSGLSRQR
jgi:hypothetical protein